MSGAAVASDRLHRRLVEAAGKKGPPVGHAVQQRRHLHDTIVATLEMRPRRRPLPVLRAPREPCSERVELHISGASQKIVLVHREGMKALPPKMPAPTLPEVDYAAYSAGAPPRGRLAGRLRGTARQSDAHGSASGTRSRYLFRPCRTIPSATPDRPRNRRPQQRSPYGGRRAGSHDAECPVQPALRCVP